MKHFFVFRMPMLVAVLMIMAACTIELARPVASHAGSAKKGGPKSLAEPFRLFSFPETTQSAYTVRDGTISFISQTPINTIEATNRNIRGALDLKTGMVETSFEMKDFVFPERLMQEHFNSDFVHSDEYPTAGFTGKIRQVENLNLATNESRTVTAEGHITLHGVTHKLNAEITVGKKAEGIRATCRFPLKPEDFGIPVPEILRVKIAEKVEVSVELNLASHARQ